MKKKYINELIKQDIPTVTNCSLCLVVKENHSHISLKIPHGKKFIRFNTTNHYFKRIFIKRTFVLADVKRKVRRFAHYK